MAETQLVVLLYYIFQQRDLGVHMSLTRKGDSSSTRLLSWYQAVVLVPDYHPSTRLLSRYQTVVPVPDRCRGTIPFNSLVLRPVGS